MTFVDPFVGGPIGGSLPNHQAPPVLPTLPTQPAAPSIRKGNDMTYNLSPRLFVENGPSIAAQAVHRRHELLYFRYAAPKIAESKSASPPEPANSDAPICGAVRFAL